MAHLLRRILAAHEVSPGRSVAGCLNARRREPCNRLCCMKLRGSYVREVANSWRLILSTRSTSERREEMTMPTPEQKATAATAAATKRYSRATTPSAKAAAAKSVQASVKRLRAVTGRVPKS